MDFWGAFRADSAGDETPEDHLLCPVRELLSPPLVCAQGRGRPLRPRHFSLRPRPLGRRNPRAGRDCQVRDKKRPLSAEKRGDLIEMDFPAESKRAVECSPHMLEKALDTRLGYVGGNRFALLVELDSEETLHQLRPNFNFLKKLSAHSETVTCLINSPEYDFVSRFSAPDLGIDEEPVTGSAHCCLGPYWAGKLGKTELVAYQASERGGVVRVRLSEDGNRVGLGGEAVTVLKGELIEK